MTDEKQHTVTVESALTFQFMVLFAGCGARSIRQIGIRDADNYAVSLSVHR